MYPPTNTLRIASEEIGFDFDGVIADIGEAFIRIACQQYNYCSFTLDDITSFSVEDCLPMPTTIIEEIFTAILADSLATGLKPLDDAIKVISEMAEQSRVTIITARPLESPVHDWLDNFFSQKTRKEITLVAMGNHDNKVRYARDHKLNYFVDDRLETCRQMAAANITPLIFRQPWNSTQDRLPAVSNWRQIHSLLELDDPTERSNQPPHDDRI